MQQTTGVAVLATHLAQTDRRALSQAWYSALHLAGEAPRSRSPMTASARPSPPAAALGARAGSVGARDPFAAAAKPGEARTGAARRNGSGREIPDGACERRFAKSVLAGRIERGLARRIERGAGRAPAAETASFVVRAANGRVHLVVRTGGAGTRVLAVCAPPLREIVKRALAHARFALAGSGFRAEAA